MFIPNHVNKVELFPKRIGRIQEKSLVEKSGGGKKAWWLKSLVCVKNMEIKKVFYLVGDMKYF